MPESQIERIWREGIGENELLMSVPHTRFILRCTAYRNQRWQVKIFDPDSDWEKEVWKSISGDDLMAIYLETVKPEYSFKSPKDCLNRLRAMKKDRDALDTLTTNS